MSLNRTIATKAQDAKTAASVSPSRKSDSFPSSASPTERILHLQRTIGNRAVGSLLKSGKIQAMLTIGQPNDRYEQEADRMADQVMRMPDPALQMKPG